jgi:Kdo2-lipid IVA lauroyltransferase/acyltransferase
MKLIIVRDLYFFSAVALVWLAPWLPTPWLRERLAAGLGLLAFQLSRRKRRLVEGSVERAFVTELSARDRRRIAQASFREFWREMLEWGLPPEATRRRLAVRGLEHLRSALARGRGAILWESHGFGYRLRAKRALSEAGFPVHQVHGPNYVGGFDTRGVTETWFRQAAVRGFFDSAEKRFVADLIYLPADGSLAFTRRLMDLLKRNEIVCITADGDSGQKFLKVPFLGQDAPFATGAVTLARMAGAALLPLFCTEEEGTLAVTLHEPVQVENAPECAIQEFVRLFEERIRKQPHRYRNYHLPADR